MREKNLLKEGERVNGGRSGIRVNLEDYEPTPGFSTSALALLPAYFRVHSKDNN